MTKSLPSQASVVVIGGGVIGCSTLYHLVKAGVRDAVLLERKQLTCGTTWHSAAQVRQLRSTNNLTQLIKYSTELYASLEEETGQAPSRARPTVRCRGRNHRTRGGRRHVAHDAFG